jgi:hypothetical protein
MAIFRIFIAAIAAADRLPTTTPHYCRLDTSLLWYVVPASQPVLVARFLRVLKKHQMRKADCSRQLFITHQADTAGGGDTVMTAYRTVGRN